MNIFKTIYCRQYHKLKPHGTSRIIRNNANNLIAIAMAALFFVCMIVVVSINPAIETNLQQWLNNTFPKAFDANVWLIFALVPLFLFYWILKVTWGTEKSYDLLISKFKLMTKEEQEKIAKRGKYLFPAILLFCLVFILVYALIPMKQ